MRGQLRGVELDDLAVVRHQAVDFAFDVGGLRVDRGGQPLFHQRLELLDQRLRSAACSLARSSNVR